MPDIDTTVTGGVEFRTYRRGAATTDGADQYVVPVEDKIVSYSGRASTFRTPGRAGTTGQTLAVIFNNNIVGSPNLVSVDQVNVDMAATTARVVLPPTIRLHRISAQPAGGLTLPKVADDTTGVSSGAVLCAQDASADQTSATALVATITAGTMLTQEYASRVLTLVGAEVADRVELLVGSAVTLRGQEGLAVFLSYTVATQNPITDMWISTIRFREFTRP